MVDVREIFRSLRGMNVFSIRIRNFYWINWIFQNQWNLDIAKKWRKEKIRDKIDILLFSS